MTIATSNRPRVLIVESDEVWRQRLRERLGSALGTGSASSVEEAIAWLEGRPPGLTVLAVAAEDPLVEEAIARIRELHPLEVVVVAAESPTVELCRRVMRVGAFDVVSRAACLGASFDRTLAEAAARLAAAQSRRRRRYVMVREAVARHERQATALLLENHAVSGAWSKLDPTLRRRWIQRYLKAAAGDAVERAAFVREMAEELSDLDQRAAVTVALHVQAVTTAHTGPAAEVPTGSRNVCIDLLAALIEREGDSRDRSGPDPDPPAVWHRWRLQEGEYWWLLVDGRLRAQVEVAESGVMGHWLAESGGTSVRSSALPKLPEALREMERRVGCKYVLDVAPAEGI